MSNIVLDELDKELETKGFNFVRYADDCNIYVRSKRAVLRMIRIRWKEWKKIKTKQTNLIKLGTDKHQAWEWANSRKAYWRISRSPILHRTLGNKYWQRLGLKSLLNRYQTIVTVK